VTPRETEQLLDTPIRQIKFAGIDFEFAGLSGTLGETPVQIGIASMDSGFALGDHQAFDSLIHFEGKSDRHAQRVHRIPPEALRTAPSFESLWPSIIEQLQGRIPVAHNCSSERRILAKFPLHEFNLWVDTLELARKVYPKIRGHKLENLIQTFDLEEDLRALCPNRTYHDALFDSWAALLFLKRLVHDANLSEWPLHSILSSSSNLPH